MRFRVLFEQAAAGVAQLQTATGKLVKVNRRLCEILGYAEEELLELTFKTITHPDDLGQDLENMRRLRSGEIRDFSMEKRYIRKDGTVIWASLSVSPMWLPGEEPEYNIGVVLDITERKRIETELYESRARYQQLFETAPVSTLEEDYSDAIEMLAGIGMEGDVRSRMTDHPGLVAQAMFAIKGLQANESAVALFGARSEADLLESLHKTVPFESYKTFSEQLAALISGKTSFQSETVKYTLDGRRIDIIEHVQAVGGSDRLDRVLVSHTDITALKQAERSLRRSGELLSTVINSIDSAISIIDVRNDSVLACNASFPRNAATGRGDSIRNSRENIVCSSYHRRRDECAFLETVRTGAQAVCEHTCTDPTGRERTIEIRTFPVRDEERKIIQIIHLGQDITVRKQAEAARIREQELRRMAAERQLVETQLRMLQAQIEPHFLFNTLAHIITLIGKEPKKAAAMLHHLTETFRVSLHRSRQGASTLGQEIDLLRDYLSIHRMRMGERLRFTFDVPKDLLGLPLPPLLLQPLVENAVMHGIESSVEGGSIAISAERMPEGGVRIVVGDTGKGLSVTSKKGGVGLSNVRERLDALYGSKARLILSENSPCGLQAAIEVPYEYESVNR